MQVSSILMTAKQNNTIALNIRYPQGTDPETIKAILEKIEGGYSKLVSPWSHLTMFRWMMSWYPPSCVFTKNKLASKDTNK